MVTEAPRPVLHAVVRAAMDGTAAMQGRLVAVHARGEQLSVVATAGSALTWPSNLVGYVVTTGQAQVVSDGTGSGLCTPCHRGDEVVGALELVGKSNARSFTIDDLQVVGLLASIAGVALAGLTAPAAPDPSRLARELTRLAAADPDRYDSVSRILDRLFNA